MTLATFFLTMTFHGKSLTLTLYVKSLTLTLYAKSLTLTDGDGVRASTTTGDELGVLSGVVTS